MDREAVDRFAALGVERLVVRPWRSRRQVLPALESFADRFLR